MTDRFIRNTAIAIGLLLIASVIGGMFLY